ncbi:MAG: nicotinate phosphoribosyltransferase, partial [Deltaproteobacteria bacterium]
MKPVLIDPSTGRRLDAVDVIDSSTDVKIGTLDSDRAMSGLRCPNLTLDTDLYELTMVAGYRLLGKQKQRACFDLYYRTNPDNGAFCVFAGLESVIDYVNNLGLYPDDIDYLGSLGIFSADALKQ